MNDTQPLDQQDDSQPPQPQPHDDSQQTELKDPEKLAKPARVFVYLDLGLSVVALVSTFMELQFVNAVEAGQYASTANLTADAEANDLRQSIVGISQLVVVVLAVIFIGRWIYYSGKNVRLLGASAMKITPGWAVGWYFVPFANLWKPYQAMKEIWKASANPLDWERQMRSPLLPVWWSFWVVSGFIDQAVFRLGINSETIADLQRLAYLSFASEGVNIVLNIVFILLLTQITRLQIDAVKNKSYLAVF